MIVTFTKYVKLVLPVDGYVFWVRADLLSQSALVGAALANGPTVNQPQAIVTPAPTVIADGSLHYATDVQQGEDQTIAVNRVLFTSPKPIEDFNQIGPSVIFIGTFDDVPGAVPPATPMRFAFSGRDWFFSESGIYHYTGRAIFSDMAPQLIDAVDGFDFLSAIVSNSLPLWLQLNGFVSANPSWFNPGVRLYPSSLSPLNLTPPFATVHIPADSTRALQAFPSFNRRLDHAQLVSERVRITLWGTRNFTALDFVDMVNQYSFDYDFFGIMGMPVVRDEHRTQAELQAKAMKKSIEFDISYYQRRANSVARQLILSAFTTLTIGNLFPAGSTGQLTDDFGNPLTDDQGNPLTDDGTSPPPPPLFNQLTDDAGNPLTDDAGNPLTDDAG